MTWRIGAINQQVAEVVRRRETSDDCNPTEVSQLRLQECDSLCRRLMIGSPSFRATSFREITATEAYLNGLVSQHEEGDDGKHATNAR